MTAVAMVRDTWTDPAFFFGVACFKELPPGSGALREFELTLCAAEIRRRDKNRDIAPVVRAPYPIEPAQLSAVSEEASPSVRRR
jgi:hypothetical protein